MNKFIFYISFVFLFSACSVGSNDELPEIPDANDSFSPVFTLRMNSNIGDPINIIAGINDVYMFTEFEKDDRNVYSFIARFAKLPSCQNNCSEALTIKIRNTRESESTEDILISEAFSIGAYDFGLVDNFDFSDVVVEYVNPDGDVFQSDLIEQNSESFFNVLSVQDFADNEKGEPTKKIEVLFNCTLKHTGSEEELVFSEAAGVIGIAYPR